MTDDERQTTPKPKRWLIEVGQHKYVMDGYGDALAAVAAWGDRGYGQTPIFVSELVSRREVKMHSHLVVEYK